MRITTILNKLIGLYGALGSGFDYQPQRGRVTLGINNGRLEGTNNKIRLLSHRSFDLQLC